MRRVTSSPAGLSVVSVIPLLGWVGVVTQDLRPGRP
jgi:hypothetical protein